MSLTTNNRSLSFRDVFTADFWRYLISALRLFFPGLLFLMLSYFCFWGLTQGKDLMVITLEHYHTFAYFILACIFWSYVSWYSSRLTAKARYFQRRDDHYIWTLYRVQGPRIIAFTCFSLIILAFFQLPAPYLPRLSETVCLLLLLVSFVWYYLLNRLWNGLLKGKNDAAFLQRLKRIIFGVLALLIVACIILKHPWALIILLIILQAAGVLLLIIRRHYIESKGESFYQQDETSRHFTPQSPVFKQLKGLVLDAEDRVYFRAFNIISMAAAVVYLATVFSVTFAVGIGSFPFVLIAFAVLLGLGNFISTLSILGRFNFHLLFIALALIMGWLFEPHYTRLPDKTNHSVVFRERQKLKEYFTNWINQRQASLDTVTKYPVYFVLANGGASRSGYWTASVLANLEDTTQGKFSEHLFCLSGASGGSVGNATFFNLLRSQRALYQDTSNSRYLDASTSYLGSDFLTYTLARMLGPDVFRYIFPLPNTYDRAAALAYAMEHAPTKNDFLYDSFAVRLSGLVTQTQRPYELPVLFINTTRMQDGSPGIISNISVSDVYFNKRLDVLNLLDTNKDMKLSSAVVLGASFPYLSPAGRINFTDPRNGKVQPQYFVDGGYFDNSGSGVVNEMINGLWQIMYDSTNKTIYPHRNKLEFFILHITNEPTGLPTMEKVHPLVNDLAAPLKTLVGSYGTQTSVNDLRLKRYIQSFYKDTTHYIELNLYRPRDTIKYSMNWVISDHLLHAMNKRLRNHDQLDSLISKMRRELR
jgi:hypothetical protein